MHELVHGHELDRRHAESLQVVDDGGVGDPGVRAALRLGHIGMRAGESGDVRLVDDALAVRDARWPVARPVEVGVDHDPEHRVRRRVVAVALARVVEPVREQRLIPVDLALHRLRVRIEQQLLACAPLTRKRVVRAVHSVPVALPGLHARQVGMPDERIDIDELDLRLDPIVVEEAELHALGHLAEESKVGAAAVEGRPQRISVSRPCVQSQAPHDFDGTPRTGDISAPSIRALWGL